jgi:hypothetical protein
MTSDELLGAIARGGIRAGNVTHWETDTSMAAAHIFMCAVSFVKQSGLT